MNTDRRILILLLFLWVLLLGWLSSCWAADIAQSAIINVVLEAGCFASDCATYGWPKAFDANNSTIYHSLATTHPTNFDMQLDGTYSLNGVKYDARDANQNGRCTSYEFYTSTDGTNWGTAVASGTWANDGTVKTASWTPVSGSYVRLHCLADPFAGYLSAEEIILTQSTGAKVGYGSVPIPMN